MNIPLRNEGRIIVKKTIRITLITIGSVLAALLLLVAVSCIVYTPEYIYRCIVNGEGKTSDYLFFPERTIEKSTRPYQYEYMLKDNLADIDVSYTMKGQLLNWNSIILVESENS
jgi:hypothetical protein